jgi:hypothetical protein
LTFRFSQLLVPWAKAVKISVRIVKIEVGGQHVSSNVVPLSGVEAKIKNDEDYSEIFCLRLKLFVIPMESISFTVDFDDQSLPQRQRSPPAIRLPPRRPDRQRNYHSALEYQLWLAGTSSRSCEILGKGWGSRTSGAFRTMPLGITRVCGSAGTPALSSWLRHTLPSLCGIQRPNFSGRSKTGIQALNQLMKNRQLSTKQPLPSSSEFPSSATSRRVTGATAQQGQPPNQNNHHNTEYTLPPPKYIHH